VLNGVPILINEDNSVFSIAEVIAHATSPTFESGVLEIAEQVLPSFHRVGTKRANYATLAGLLLARTSDPKVLVVGAGKIGAGMEPLLNACPPIRLVETDVAVRSRTRVACDAHDLPFADQAFDGVVVQAVLEHVLDPHRCVAEIHRVLAPEGFVYAETPFMVQVHAGPHDFTRFTHLGHRRLFRYFDEVASGTGQGPGTALAWAYQYFALSFATSRRARAVIRGFTQLTSFYLKYVDAYLARKPGVFDASSGYFFLGRKADTPLPDRELIAGYRGALR
jgi:SAM-dependent methyltransferase